MELDAVPRRACGAVVREELLEEREGRLWQAGEERLRQVVRERRRARQTESGRLDALNEDADDPADGVLVLQRSGEYYMSVGAYQSKGWIRANGFSLHSP